MQSREERIQAGLWVAALWLLRDPDPIIRAHNRHLVDTAPTAAQRRNQHAYAAEGIRYLIRRERAERAADGVLPALTSPILGRPEGYHYLQNHLGQCIADEFVFRVAVYVLGLPKGQRGCVMRRICNVGRRAIKGQQALKLIGIELRACRQGNVFDCARWKYWKRREERVQRALDAIDLKRIAKAVL